MRSPFGQRLIAFLLTAAFLWCFYGAVIKRSQRRARQEILAEEEYRELQDYVAENGLDYEKIRKVCYGSDSSDQGFVVDYLAMAMICALTIIPYSILLRLIRRFADPLSDSHETPQQHKPPQEYAQ